MPEMRSEDMCDVQDHEPIDLVGITHRPSADRFPVSSAIQDVLR